MELFSWYQILQIVMHHHIWHDIDGAIGPEYTIQEEIMFGLKMILQIIKILVQVPTEGLSLFDFPYGVQMLNASLTLTLLILIILRTISCMMYGINMGF
jgi:hypothetical protein